MKHPAYSSLVIALLLFLNQILAPARVAPDRTSPFLGSGAHFNHLAWTMDLSQNTELVLRQGHGGKPGMDRASTDSALFWQTVWVSVLGVLVLISLLAVGFRWRVHSIETATRRLETLVAERTRELLESKHQLEIEIEQRTHAETELAKRAEQELHQSEERFRAAFESSAIGMALMTIDGHFVKANAAIRKMSGYTDAELAHLTADDIVWPEDRAVGLELFAEIMAGQRDYYQVERRYVRKNGDLFWTRLTLSAMEDTTGRPIYLIALVEDIDEQKRTLLELRKSEARFQAVFENAAVGIVLISLDGRVLAINPTTEQICGYSLAELTSTNPLDLAFAEDRGVDTGLFQELITGQRDFYVVEMRFHRKTHGLGWVRINYSLVRDPDGQPDYLIALLENIDEEKRAAEKLAEQEKEYRRALEQRITERTEELKQANQLLQQQAAQEAVNSERTRLARDLHDAVTQTLFSASLIAEVLPELWDLNQSEARRRVEELRQLTRGALAEMRMLLVELRPNALVEVPLPDLLRQLTEAFTGRARLPIQLNVDGHCVLPPDVQLALYRITQEALNNIVKHAHASQVLVTLRLTDRVRLSIVDNGGGFDPAVVPVDHLGLQIMRERAASIDATFAVYSAPGEGTQITVTWSAPLS